MDKVLLIFLILYSWPLQSEEKLDMDEKIIADLEFFQNLELLENEVLDNLEHDNEKLNDQLIDQIEDER
jgi:hypothetical protein